jgi:hypothetical protein
MLTAMMLLAFAAEAMAQKRSPAVTRDRDHDGVPDVRDRCPATPPGVPVDATGCPAGGTPAGLPPAAAAPARTPPPEPAPPAASRMRIGLGFGLSPQYGALVLPVLLAAGTAIEPEIGVSHSSADIAASGFTDRQSQTLLRLGVGITFQVARIGSTRLYAGPRAGLIHTWSSDDDGTGPVTTSSTDPYVALATGGECFVAPRASIGAEVSAAWMRLHQDVSGVSIRQSDFQAGGRLAGRWYFR